MYAIKVEMKQLHQPGVPVLISNQQRGRLENFDFNKLQCKLKVFGFPRGAYERLAEKHDV